MAPFRLKSQVQLDPNAEPRSPQVDGDPGDLVSVLPSAAPGPVAYSNAVARLVERVVVSAGGPPALPGGEWTTGRLLRCARQRVRRRIRPRLGVGWRRSGASEEEEVQDVNRVREREAAVIVAVRGPGAQPHENRSRLSQNPCAVHRSGNCA